MSTPICLFTYNRLAEARETIKALQKNYLAPESDLIIFSDGGKDALSWDKVDELRKYLRTIEGFKSIEIRESDVNIGLANSIIQGVSSVIEQYGKVIILEDDLATSRNFLDYMNQALDYYENNKQVLSISGFSFSDNIDSTNFDAEFGVRASSWGWATWKNRWNKVDWEVKNYPKFRYDLLQHYKFNKGGSDMSRMLYKQMSGKINSWAIRFCFHQFENNLVDVYPTLSKVQNIGIGKNATNSKTGHIRFKTKLDCSDNRQFIFNPTVALSKKTLSSFRWHHSIFMRLLDHLVLLLKNDYKSDIIVFHPALAPYRIDFFNYLALHFDTLFYFSSENPKEQSFDQELLRSQLKFEYTLYTQGFELFNRTIRFGILSRLYKCKPRIVICSEYSQTTVVTLLYKLFLNKKLKVYTISDDSLELSKQRKGIRKWIRTVSANFLDGIIFPSSIVGEWYTRYVNVRPKILELPIIHSNEVFRKKLSASLNDAAKNAEYNHLVGKKVFLFVGRLVKIKNVDFLLRAFAQAEIENSVLVIVGNGEEEEKLKSLRASLNLSETCIFTGKIEGEELLSWYNIAQCFVLPSYVEPYGAVVNEALLAGCKVLCSNLAGSSELITNENGAIFDPFNVEELVYLLQHMGNEIEGIKLPIVLRHDLMSFQLEEKLKKIVNSL
jgi:glycosyltransferase involved in cell wall biosynthesis